MHVTVCVAPRRAAYPAQLPAGPQMERVIATLDLVVARDVHGDSVEVFVGLSTGCQLIPRSASRLRQPV
jgi:hypothetical protein